MTLDDCEIIFSKALSSKSESEFSYEIERLWPFYELLSIGLGRGSIFWRARLIEDEVYPSVEDLEYPPKEFSGLGRLNDKGSPCFYAAKNIETALIEIGAKEGQLVQLAGFRVLLNCCLRLALIGEYANVQKTGYISFSGSDPDRTISRIINGMPIHKAMRCIYIDKFYSNILADVNAKSENYFKSRALGAIIHYRISADGIAFPSIKDKGGINIAVRPALFDEKMHNVSCLVVKIVRERRYGLLEYKIIKSAKKIDDERKFCWSAGQNPEIIGIYGMTKNEYEFAMKEPHNKSKLMDLTSFYNQKG